VPVTDQVRLVQFDWIGAKRLLLVRLEVIYAETIALLSRGRGVAAAFTPNYSCLKKIDILEINIC
jgi:hypothetical protein